MKFFDTHTHVNLPEFANDQDQVIQRALDTGTWMINVGTSLESSKLAVEISQKYPDGVFAALGLHPTDSKDSFIESEFEKLLNDKVVAIGECGLDYYRLIPDNRESEIKRQKQEFIKQIAFAKKHKLALIVHCRDLPTPELRQAGAYEDVLEILKAEYVGGPGVIHSFTDTWDTAKKFLDFGFYVALNGILTFDKTGKLAEVAEKTPIEKLLIETDAPYLTPPPNRGKRNEPSYVQYVAGKVAEIKKISPEEAGAQTFRNACELFKIKIS